MIQFLVMQIRLGKITLDQLPTKYKDAVKKELDK